MRVAVLFLGVVSAATGWLPVLAQDEIRFVDGLRAEHVTVFLFETGLSGGSVQSVGDRDVKAWIHAGGCLPVVIRTNEEDVYQSPLDRDDGQTLLSFGHIRNSALAHVEFNDDSGTNSNFLFSDLDASECYVLLAEGFGQSVSGNYGVQFIGIAPYAELSSISYSRDSGFGGWMAHFDAIRLGNDSGLFAGDGECDDTRFTGDGEYLGITVTDDYVMRDASDCRRLFMEGLVRLKDTEMIDFGDDSSVWANDGECDDVRFTGPSRYLGITSNDDHVRRDASDCRQLFVEGLIRLKR